jgi:uncharacterized damage-inducible protein DinB
LDDLWIEAFFYHRWANLHLLEVCSKLPGEQLQLTSGGTYGTVAATFLHLLAAEQRYLFRLTGAEAQIKEIEGFPGIARLTELAADSGARLIEAARRTKPDAVIEATVQDGRFSLPLGIVLIQALHHGNDHRTHICTILGDHGIPYGGMDVWAYGDATGAIVPLPASG